jgi:hypothetical protein
MRGISAGSFFAWPHQGLSWAKKLLKPEKIRGLQKHCKKQLTDGKKGCKVFTMLRFLRKYTETPACERETPSVRPKKPVGLVGEDNVFLDSLPPHLVRFSDIRLHYFTYLNKYTLSFTNSVPFVQNLYIPCIKIFIYKECLYENEQIKRFG